MQTERQTKRNISVGELYQTELVRCSFWSWFDANRSTFDEDMREKKRFLADRTPTALTVVLLVHRCVRRVSSVTYCG